MSVEEGYLTDPKTLLPSTEVEVGVSQDIVS